MIHLKIDILEGSVISSNVLKQCLLLEHISWFKAEKFVLLTEDTFSLGSSMDLGKACRGESDLILSQLQ